MAQLEMEERVAAKRRGGAVRAGVFGAVSACALLWVAAWNGYPTVFSDTGSYIYTGKFFVVLWPFRAPGYSVFTRFASLGTSGWFVIIAQAIVVVWVLHETCRWLIGGERVHTEKLAEGSDVYPAACRGNYRENCLLGIVCAVVLLTSLPWEVSLLMPDVFAGVVFLAAFLLAFNDEMGLGKRGALAVLLTIAVGAHTSLLLIAGAFAVALVIARVAGRMPWKPALAWLLAPIVAAGIGTAALNYEMGVGFRLSPAGNEFLLARLVSDGLAKDYLQANCPQRAFLACGDIGNLPMSQNWFLFYHPLTHEIERHGDEIGEIVRGTLTAYPLRFAGSSVAETARQLAAIRTGEEIRSSTATAWNAGTMQRVFPRDVAALANSRQSRGTLTPLVNALARVHEAVFWLSLAGCLIIGVVKKPRVCPETGPTRSTEETAAICRARVDGFFYAALVFLVINAAVCASLSGVFDRYQTRVSWLVPLCLMFHVCGAVEERKRAST